jgi:hypothetical protein
MQTMVVRIAGAILLVGVAACSGPPWTPWTLHQSADAITVRWYPDDTDIVAANQLANLHCRYWGKTALLATDLRDGSAEVAQYICR